MNILVTGASGLIGSRLVPELARAGHRVARGVRHPSTAPDEVGWDSGTGVLEPRRAFDAVIHLAGHGLATGRWTAAHKRRAWSSRVDATRALCEGLAKAPAAPRVMVCASAIGIYGDRGDEPLDESSPTGTGYLPDLARAWEAACEPLASAGARIVNLRLGLVLAAEGGALPPLLRPARWGLGGPLGSGCQFWSWVAIEDAVAVFVRALARPEISGPVNAVGPEPVRQRDLARTLGRVLRRPAFFPVPAVFLRLMLGEMADAALLASARVLPRRLIADGYAFLRPDLEGALRAALGEAG